MSWPRWIRDGSRSVRALIAVSAGILVVGLGLAALGFRVAPPVAGAQKARYIQQAYLSGVAPVVEEMLADETFSDADLAQIFSTVCQMEGHLYPEDQSTWEDALTTTLSETTARPDLVPILRIVWAIQLAGEDGKAEALEALRVPAQSEPPVRWANWFLSEAYIVEGEWAAGARAAEREWNHFADVESANRAISLYREAGNAEGVLRLESALEEAGILEHFGPSIRLAYENRDWVRFVTLLVRSEMTAPLVAKVVVCLVGAIWCVVLLSILELRINLRNLAWMVVGMIMGALSIVGVMLWYMVEEDLGIEFTPVLPEGVIYAVLGIGLREELFKLLVFAPLIPFLHKKGRRMQLLVACSVGLGFALAENLGYYGPVGVGGVVTVRFLSANLAHIVWTGMVGIACCRAWSNPRSHGIDFLAQFAIVVALHGMYDAFLMVHEFAEVSFLAMILFVVSNYLFFQEVERYHERTHWPVSTAGIYIVGLALIVAVSMQPLALVLGAWQALGNLTAPIIEMAFALIVFLRCVPNGLRLHG